MRAENWKGKARQRETQAGTIKRKKHLAKQELDIQIKNNKH